MPALKIEDFSGTVPVKGDRALPENFATDARNTWLYSNELIGVRLPKKQQAINNNTEKVFRVPLSTVGGDPADPTVPPPPAYLGDSHWMQFTEPDTDIVRGPLVEDQYRRYYFCAPRTGLRFNTYARMIANQPPYRVGVPPPDDKPILVAGGVRPTEPGEDPPPTAGAEGDPKSTRAYIWTYENEFGEESMPSPPETLEHYDQNIWTVTLPNVSVQTPSSVNPPDSDRPPGLPVLNEPPSPYAKYMKVNLYRTITSEAGVATYFKVKTWDYTSGTPAWPAEANIVHDDYLSDEDLAGELQLETSNYELPPGWLQGIIAMPNGFLIGWADSTLYMSEPYQLHAWPIEYAISTEFPVVGLGVLGTTCVVCTQSFPATLSGVKPVVMSFTKSTSHEPCVSRGSIVSTPQGIFYASQNGLVSVSSGGIANITHEFITRAEWMKTYQPSYIRACRYQNGYLALRAIPNRALRSAFFFDPTAIKVALTEFTDFDHVVQVQSDAFSGETFVLKGSGTRFVFRWDPPEDLWMPTLWKTKEFQIPNNRNFGCYAIYWDESRFTPGDALAPDVPIYGDFIGVDERVHFTVWCDRIQRYSATVAKNGEAIRLPSGFKGDIWQFEIRARAPVYALHLASSVKELGGF